MVFKIFLLAYSRIDRYFLRCNNKLKFLNILKQIWPKPVLDQNWSDTSWCQCSNIVWRTDFSASVVKIARSTKCGRIKYFENVWSRLIYLTNFTPLSASLTTMWQTTFWDCLIRNVDIFYYLESTRMKKNQTENFFNSRLFKISCEWSHS